MLVYASFKALCPSCDRSFNRLTTRDGPRIDGSLWLFLQHHHDTVWQGWLFELSCDCSTPARFGKQAASSHAFFLERLPCRYSTTRIVESSVSLDVQLCEPLGFALINAMAPSAFSENVKRYRTYQTAHLKQSGNRSQLHDWQNG